MEKLDFSKDRYRYDLLMVCRRLHGANCGSGDPMTVEDLCYFNAWLIWRDKKWNYCTYSEYDRMVHLLVRATIQETEENITAIIGV